MGRPGELKLDPDRPFAGEAERRKDLTDGLPCPRHQCTTRRRWRHFFGQTFTAFALSTAIDAVFEAIVFFTLALSR